MTAFLPDPETGPQIDLWMDRGAELLKEYLWQSAQPLTIHHRHVQQRPKLHSVVPGPERSRRRERDLAPAIQDLYSF